MIKFPSLSKWNAPERVKFRPSFPSTTKNPSPEIAKSVTDGFADKGMPPWGPVLGPDKVRKVSAFVLTLKGKNLPGKEPQGSELE